MIEVLSRIFARGKGSAATPREGLLRVPMRPPRDSLKLRAALVNTLWREMGIYEQDRHELFTAPLLRLAATVGELPASEAHHGSQAGGLLTHSLEAALLALREHNAQGPQHATTTDPVQRELFRVPWQYATFVSALLHDVGKIFYQRVHLTDGTIWDPLRETLWSFCLRHPRPNLLLVEHLSGRGLYRHERFAAGFLFEVLGAAGKALLGPEILAKLLQHAAGAHKEVMKDSPGQRNAQTVRKGDQESVRLDQARSAQKARPETRLADLVLEGLRLLLTQGEFTINGKGAEVYVGAQSTAVVVPVTLRAAVELMRRREPRHPDLRHLPPRKESAIFSALGERDWVASPAGRSVLWAQVHYPGPGHSSDTPLNVLLLKNDVLWKGLDRPESFKGHIVFTNPKDGAVVETTGFHAPGTEAVKTPVPAAQPKEPAAPPDPTTVPPLPIPEIATAPTFTAQQLLEDLAAAALAKRLRCNKPGAQMYVLGEETILVTPAAIKRAVGASSRAYPQPLDLHLNAIYDALAASGVARIWPGERIVQCITLEGVRSPLNVIMLKTEALLDAPARLALGSYPGTYQLASAEATA